MRILILAISTLFAASALGWAQQAPASLTGRWVLKTEPPLPGGPDSTARDSLGRGPSAPDSVLPPAGGPSRPARRPERRGPSERDLRQVQLLLGMAQPVPSFTLELTDTTLTVVNEGGFTYTVYVDGRKTTIPLSDSVDIEARGRWKDGLLAVEYRPTGGGKLTETYALADSRLFLRLEVEVEHGLLFRPRWQARMYRRADAEPPEP